MCIWHILLRDHNMAVLPGCWWSWSPPASPSAFLLIIQVGISSTRFFPGLSLPEVLTALATQEALGQLGPAKLCVSLFLQAILGKLLFGEMWTPLWWVGLAMTVCGLMLLHTAAPQLVQVPAEKKE